jgi:hypothetical protein
MFERHVGTRERSPAKRSKRNQCMRAMKLAIGHETKPDRPKRRDLRSNILHGLTAQVKIDSENHGN